MAASGYRTLSVSLSPDAGRHLVMLRGSRLIAVRAECRARGRAIFPAGREERDRLLAFAQAVRGEAAIASLEIIGDAADLVSGRAIGMTCARAALLVDARLNRPIDHVGGVAPVRVEISDWELHHFGVEIAEAGFVEAGYQIVSSNAEPGVNPQLWVRRAGQLFACLVRTARHPVAEPELPLAVAEKLVGEADRQGATALFCGISLGGDDGVEGVTPLWRGEPAFARYDGPKPLRPLIRALC